VSLAERLVAVTDAIATACEACGRDRSTVVLLPVSKRHPEAAILEAEAAGLTMFGENRVQELVEKSRSLADAAIGWHFVGSLQTNKVAALLEVPSLSLLQTLDRRKLADTLQRDLAATGRTLRVLIQVNATHDAAKHGATPDDARALMQHITRECPSLIPEGLMAMGPLHDDPTRVFELVAKLHEDLRQSTGLPLETRSMGMTSDLAPAIAAGSTMVRIGTALFGPRP
jgi:PLP dependent protein